MQSASFNRGVQHIHWVPATIALGLIIGGSILLTGWRRLLIPQPSSGVEVFLPSARIYLAAVVLLSGFSLGLQIHPSLFSSLPWNRLVLRIARFLAAVMILLGIISVIDVVIGMSAFASLLHRLSLLQHIGMGKHTMSLLAALCAILSGIGLLRLDDATRDMRYPAEYCALAVASLMCIPIIGFLFDVQILGKLIPAPAISPEAPPAFLLLSIGILCSRPRHPMMAVLFSRAPGGRLLRTVLPATLLLLVGLALLARWGAHQGLYGENMVTPIALLIGGALLLVLFWRAALMLNQEYGSRVKGEAELAKTNDLIRIVSDFTTDAICVQDRKGRYIFANPMALKVFGQKLESVVGHTSSDVLNDKDVAAAIESSNQNVLSEGKASAIEFTLQTANGLRTYYLTTAPWFNKQGTVMGTVGISTDITDRKLAEDAMRAQEAKLERLVEARTQEVRELIGHIETLREEEKRTIARELHDDMGASLTALNMHLAILFQQLPSEPGMAERIVQIKALLGTITATKRRIQNGLRPDKLDIFGIKIAISDQAQDFENYTGITCAVSFPDEEVKYSSEVETSLFRMVQEALNNIAKHAKATHVDIILDDDSDHVLLTIRDNGIGISPEARPYHPTHGLRGMRERAAYLGGRIAIDSKPGGGTRISISLPKTRTAALPDPVPLLELPRDLA